METNSHETLVLSIVPPPSVGMPHRDGNKYYISMVAVGPEGNLMGHYDKLHIA